MATGVLFRYSRRRSCWCSFLIMALISSPVANNKWNAQDGIYGAVIMTKWLPEFTGFSSSLCGCRVLTLKSSLPIWAVSLCVRFSSLHLVNEWWQFNEPDHSLSLGQARSQRGREGSGGSYEPLPSHEHRYNFSVSAALLPPPEPVKCLPKCVNSLAAGAPLQSPLGKLTTLPRPIFGWGWDTVMVVSSWKSVASKVEPSPP